VELRGDLCAFQFYPVGPRHMSLHAALVQGSLLSRKAHHLCECVQDPYEQRARISPLLFAVPSADILTVFAEPSRIGR
jgi:hypothetical protein